MHAPLPVCLASFVFVQGISNSILLENSKQELFVLTSALARPVSVKVNSGPQHQLHTFKRHNLFWRGDPEWVQAVTGEGAVADKASRHFLYAVHSSRAFLSTITPGSSSLVRMHSLTLHTQIIILYVSFCCTFTPQLTDRNLCLRYHNLHRSVSVPCVSRSLQASRIASLHLLVLYFLRQRYDAVFRLIPSCVSGADPSKHEREVIGAHCFVRHIC